MCCLALSFSSHLPPLQVSIDVRAPEAGTLVEQLAGEGDTVEVGAPLMKLSTSGGGGGGAAKPAPKPAPAPAPGAKGVSFFFFVAALWIGMDCAVLSPETHDAF